MLIWGVFWYYFAGLGAEGGQQQLKDANHDGSREPGRADGRLKFAIRSLFITFGVAREAHIRNPLAICKIWRGPRGSHSQSARYLRHLAWPAAATKRESPRIARARSTWGGGARFRGQR